MNNFPHIKNELNRLKPELKAKFDVNEIGFFDCYIDHHHNRDCELNLLVKLGHPLGWDFFGLKEFLEYKLQMRIDIFTERALKPALRDEILSQTTFV